MKRSMPLYDWNPIVYMLTKSIPYTGYQAQVGQSSLAEQFVLDLFGQQVPFLCYREEKKTESESEIEVWKQKKDLRNDLYHEVFEENQYASKKAEKIIESNEMNKTEKKQEREEELIIHQPENTQNQLFQLLKNEEPIQFFSKKDLKDIDILKKRFYTVDAATDVSTELLDIEKLLQVDTHMEKKNEPQILIYHTHSQEAFADSLPGDVSTGIVGVGEFLAHLLSEQYGYQVIHHCGQYDVESRDYAYANAAPALEALLQEYPSIEVVIDLHRDAVKEGTHLITNINGIDVAQFMLFEGLSYTRERGAISYLANPYIENNLALAFKMKLAAECYYPGLTRKIYLKGYRYNMHYCSKSMLIELGAQTNTLQEVMNACIPLAHTIDMVLSDQETVLVE